MKIFTDDPIIRYQVAIKKISEAQSPILLNILREEKSAQPNLEIIAANEQRLEELFELQSNLRIEDTDQILAILNGSVNAI